MNLLKSTLGIERGPSVGDDVSAAQAQRHATEGVARFGVCLRYPVVFMGDHPDAQPTPSPVQAPEGRLDSWKEIAAYLGRGIRTVQRWEREEGLPVHRLVHEKRGSIYARREELAAWWESRRLTLAAPSPSDAVEAPVAPRLERVTFTTALTSWPALSSDARLIAYVSDAGQDGTTPQIWSQQIGGAALRLTNGERQYSHLSFSPDNTRILFTASDDAGPNVYEVPTLGGEPRLLQRGASRGCISPDGRWFACVPHDAAGIRVAARGGAGFRTVAAQLVRCGVRDVVAGQPIRARPCPCRIRRSKRIGGLCRSTAVPRPTWDWSSGSARQACSPYPTGRRGWMTRWCSRRLGTAGCVSTDSASRRRPSSPRVGRSG